MPHLQRRLVLLGQLQHPPGLFERGGDGFFHQHAQPAPQKRIGDGGMVFRRRCDGDHIHPFNNVAVIRHRLTAVLLGQTAGFVHIGVHHRHQFHAVDLMINPAVQTSHFPRPDNRGA